MKPRLGEKSIVATAMSDREDGSRAYENTSASRHSRSKRFCFAPVYSEDMRGLIPSDPVIIVVVLILLSLIFFLYLLLRRTVLEFRDGMGGK